MTSIADTYFKAFNEKNIQGMLDCLSDDIEHHPNGGSVRKGKETFEAFCKHMFRCYDEELVDMVVFAARRGQNITAQYVVRGTYLETDGGLPEARGQTYSLPCRSYMVVADGLITKLATVYDRDDWIAQVS
jgi:steroid delta-isomerase-like uncharacterized protein